MHSLAVKYKRSFHEGRWVSTGLIWAEASCKYNQNYSNEGIENALVV